MAGLFSGYPKEVTENGPDVTCVTGMPEQRAKPNEESGPSELNTPNGQWPRPQETSAELKEI